MDEFEWGFTLVSNRLGATVLYENDDYHVIAYGSMVELWLHGGWNSSCARMARKFGVQGLSASEGSGWSDDSLEFLDELPGLRWVLVSTSRKLNWKPLERQADLESVDLFPNSSDQNEIDFTCLPSLRKCAVNWRPQFDSIRHCRRLNCFEVRDSDLGNLRELDLRELVDLEQLIVDSCIRLGSIEPAEQAQIRALKASDCPKLKLDLKRLVRDLQYLYLEGKLAYPLDELRLAKHLKSVVFLWVRAKTPIPPVLDQLPCLADGLAAGTRLSEPDQNIMDTFAARRREQLEAEKRKNSGGK
jgi:hypothetical protein